MKNIDLKHFSTDAELAKAAAENWLATVNEAARKNENHLVALSGGRIAKLLFAQIVEQTTVQKISLSHVHFFWADERCVAPDDPESNFRTANELLFQPLKIARSQIHRLKGELSPEISAMDANVEIFRMATATSRGLPVLNYIFLGMGEDGHVASLFPNAVEKNISRNDPYFFVENSPKPPPNRLSLSYSSLAAAREILVLVSGSGKSEALKNSLEQTGSTPLARVLKSRTSTKIYTDISL